MVLHTGVIKLKHIKECKICQERVLAIIMNGESPDKAIRKFPLPKKV